VPVLSLSVNPDALLDERRIGICAGSYAKLVNELARLIRDEPLRERMGEAARLHAAATYADKSHLETLARLITSGTEGIAPGAEYPARSEASALERTMPRGEGRRAKRSNAVPMTQVHAEQCGELLVALAIVLLEQHGP